MAAGAGQTSQALGSPAAAWTGRPDRLVTGLLAGVAMVLAGVATAKGPGLSPDSVAYLSTGINLAGSHGLLMLDDGPLTVFAPGLPMIAALGDLIGVGAVTTLRILSIASFGAIVALGGEVLRRTVRTREIALGSTALLALSPALLGISQMAWSEPPFVALTLVFLLRLSSVWERRSLTRADTAILAGSCWVAFLLRYAGMALIAMAGITLLIVLRPLGRRALGQVAAFGALSATVPVAWMLRNLATDHTILGPRRPSPDSLADVAHGTAATVGGWILPVSGVVSARLAALGVAGTLVVTVGVAATMRAGTTHDTHGTRAGSRPAVLCCALFVVVYSSYLMASTLTTAISLPNSRYLSPVYVPLVALAAVAAETIVERLVRPRRSTVLVVLALGAFVVGQGFTTVRDARDSAARGIGLGSTAAIDSAVAAVAGQLVERTDDAMVYSNDPSALWAATRMQPIRFAPRDRGVRDLPVTGELEGFVHEVGCHPGTTLLVVFLVGDDRVTSLSEIQKVADVERVGVAADGAVFRVTVPPSADCASRQARPTLLP